MLNIARSVIKFSQNVKPNISINNQQVRTTFILKRRWEPRLNKNGYRPKRMKTKNFIYDLVENTEVKKKPEMTLILTKYVEGLGHKGDEVSVKQQFGYNKLLLTGLATYCTPENKAKYARDQNQDEGEQHSSPHVGRTIGVLSRICIAVVMNKETPWTLEPWHIRASLRKAGVHISDDSVITMPPGQISGPDMSLENKEFFVTLTINNLEKGIVRCRIHHWSTQPSDRLPWVSEHWCKPAEPIFPEQAEALENMQLPVSKIPKPEIPQLY